MLFAKGKKQASYFGEKSMAFAIHSFERLSCSPSQSGEWWSGRGHSDIPTMKPVVVLKSHFMEVSPTWDETLL